MTNDHSAQIMLIEGADALAFAQAQFSSNVQSLEVGQWQFSAWLDAQGRVRALFHLARPNHDALLVLLRGGTVEPMAQSLQRYVFRAKVRLTALPPCTLGTGPALESYAYRREGDGYVFGCGTHSLVTGAPADMDWRLPQILAGWPWLPGAALDQLLPASLSLEHLGAVAFDKGCYPGQEVVARLHYRGGLKRHMHCVVLSQPLTEGTVLRLEGKPVVQILEVDIAQTDVHALAVIDDDATRQLENSVFAVDEHPISMRITESWPA
ncbi:folate-binding protein YgfZ [Dyella sp. C9]|uniref:CAF17-like 4Fe-4S cluster assembly/insertion protein YgfZ n=1 Tax=Dyella sp. C9 TaxID=2202154 RepID=UPI000DEFC4A1|nr:folate-binding protein YgfZ [Dyella sp. C9]